ncbi:hypothetical protein [Candidatus Mesenet endosymbiont of Agriotes lineatus]|uniref:hypothetical protein n=1 Tax=Candidatus Mesenet endosymbiont of Agriotes lineatus TaxID=3077948 RepID=UPI0030D56496
MPQELEKLKEIIITILVDNDNKLKEEGLKIINELGRDHINDELTIDENKKGTILGCLILCDSQNGVRLNNATLKELEGVIIRLGGKLKISERDMEAGPNSILAALLSREDPRPRSGVISVSDLEFIVRNLL